MKKIAIVILLGVLVGVSFAIYMFSDVEKSVAAVMSDDYIVTAFQIGVYSVYDNALNASKTHTNSYIYHDEDKYRVFLAIYQDQEIISLLENYYSNENINVYLKKMSANNEFIDELKKYEQLLKQSGNLETYLKANKNILKVFEDTLWVI